jgi:hypothetical protein
MTDNESKNNAPTNTGLCVLNDGEVAQVSGGMPPLVVWGLWVGGGALVGFAAAAAVHYFGNGSHNHK